MKEQALVPELRFKGFSEPFREVNGAHCFENSREKGEAGLAVYSVTMGGLVPRSTLEKHMKNDAADGDNLRAREGDLVYNMMRMWQGAVGLSYLECMVSPAYVVLRPKQQVSPAFFAYHFKRARSLYLLWAYSQGLTSDRLRLYYRDFAKIPFALPTKEEQQKIADFLSAVDKKISLLKDKHRLLVQYKKGVMQQIFSQQIRFNDDNGQDFPAWEEVRLEEIATPVKRKAEQVIENVMTISAGRGFLHQTERFNQVIAGTSLDKYTHLKSGEFSYNRGNSKSYTYGCIYKLEEDEALVPYVYRSFKLDEGYPDFYLFLFENKYLDRQLRRLISSSARMDGLLNIGEKDFYKVKLPFPSMPEQKKIGRFFKALDKKIETVNLQLEQAQTYKKGLLQKMFV